MTFVAYLASTYYEDNDFRILYAGPDYEAAYLAASTATALWRLTTYTYIQTWVNGVLVNEENILS